MAEKQTTPLYRPTHQDPQLIRSGYDASAPRKQQKRRSSSIDTGTPAKRNCNVCSLALIFPSRELLSEFASRSGSLKVTDTQDVLLFEYEGRNFAAAAADEMTLRNILTTLSKYCRATADIVVLFPALISSSLKATPGTVHKMTICKFTEGKPSKSADYSKMSPETLSTMKIETPESGLISSGQFYTISCSLWAREEIVLKGIVKCDVVPHAFFRCPKGRMQVHLAAACIGNIETLETDKRIQEVFDPSIAANCTATAAFELLRQFTTKANEDIHKALHEASALSVPESMLTSRDDDTNPERILPQPHSTLTLERNQELLSSFFRLQICPRIYGEAATRFAIGLIGDKECRSIQTTVSNEVPPAHFKEYNEEFIYGVFCRWKEIRGKGIDFLELKCLFTSMGHTELAELCNTFYIEHAFTFKLHRLDCCHGL